MNTTLKVKNLVKYFPVGGIYRKKMLHAVDNVSFNVLKGETFGLVGESGCGKTTLGRLILRLLQPSAGEVRFKDVNVFRLKGILSRRNRREMQIIFQDPLSSLNPRMNVRDTIGYPMKIHHMAKEEELDEKISQLLEKVGLSREFLKRYPHEFSSGQRQRVVIARALALEPELIVLDEPTSALDVCVQAQILNNLKDLQKASNITYVFISHNLAVIRYMCDVIAVMYLGKIVELAPTETLFGSCRHPYAQALISAIPIPDPETKRKRIPLSGEIPSPIDPPPGCRFSKRCPKATSVCFESEPELVEVEKEHLVSCHQ